MKMLRLVMMPIMGAILSSLPLSAITGELPRADETKATRFVLVVRTSDVDKAGTDADIDLGLTWTNGDGEKKGEFFVLPQGSGGGHEKSNVDVHAIKLDTALPIQSVYGAQLVNEMGGSNPGWHVHSVALLALDGNDELWVLANAPINRWLERKKPSMTALAIPMLKEPKRLGSRMKGLEISQFAFAQDLPDGKRRDVSRAITDDAFKSPGRTRDWPE